MITLLYSYWIGYTKLDRLNKFYKKKEYLSNERLSYLMPINKWKSEELFYPLVRNKFNKHKVIYQHRPYFLKSSKEGQMSYDIFISNIDVAIEYQGRQHFEPIDFFGVEEAYKQGVRRDSEKLKLSTENGIALIYINY